MRTQVKSQLQALALNQGVQRKWKLWSKEGRKQLEPLPLMPWTTRRRMRLSPQVPARTECVPRRRPNSQYYDETLN
jgi:hypothetical protein